MSDITEEMSAAAPSVPQAESLWPQTIVGIALSATVVWTVILGYGFVRLMTMLI
jgi:hypothetical protein